MGKPHMTGTYSSESPTLEMATQPMPRPWRVYEKSDGVVVSGENPVLSVCVCTREANSALIVKAVNSYAAHQECVELLREARPFFSEHIMESDATPYMRARWERYRAALAKLSEPSTETVG